MKDKRRRKVWVNTPEDAQSTANGIRFRLAEEWYSLGGEKITLPITLLAKIADDGNTEKVSEPYPALLDQYGGEGLLLDMALSDQDFEAGTTWELVVYPDGDREINIVEEDDE